MERSREQLVARHQQEMLVGALIAVGSLAGTVLSYVLAFGGRFWILWGGVVAGVLVFGRAHARWRSARGR